jgi:outer membrane protein TolC
MTRSAPFRIGASLLLASSLLLAERVADGAETANPKDELTALLAGEIVPGGLTSTHAARRAVETSDELDARRSDNASAAASVDQARGGYVPRVTLSAGYKRLSEVESSTAFPIDSIEDNYETRAEAAVPISDWLLRTPNQVDSARHSEAATRAAGEAEVHDVGLGARLAYYEWVRARLGIRVAEHALVQAEWHTSEAQKSAQAGSKTRADVLTAESQQADARLTLSRARDAEVLAREELRIRLHDGDQVAYAIGEDLLADVTGEAPSFEQLWSEAQRRRPELRAARAQTSAYREQAEAQRAAWLPRVDVVGGVTHANPNQRDFPPEEEWSSSWDVGVKASWNVNELFGGRAGQEAIEHKASASRSREKVARDQVRIEVLRAHEAYRAAREEIVGSMASLAAASEAYRVRRAQYESGHATSVELIDAELGLTRARFDAVNAYVDLRIALARIDHAVGR